MAVYMWYKSLVSLASWWVVKPCKIMSKKWHGHNLQSRIVSSKKLNIQGISPRENLNEEHYTPQKETWMQQTSRL